MPQTEPFVIDKEKGLIPAVVELGNINRAADIEPELILCESSAASAVGIVRKVFASKSAFLKNSYALPCNWFDPDLEVKFTTPPANRPYSGERLFVATLNSCSESCVGINAVMLI